MHEDAATVIALQALGWLAADDELFPVFLGATGAGAGDLRARAVDPLFHGAVLDFLMQEDRWITAFCDQNGLPYTAPQAARAALPGGDVPNWT
ncbi:Protein of unknown function DUF3572 [Paracoccaceae bacterium]|jgi:hypothetical protein